MRPWLKVLFGLTLLALLVVFYLPFTGGSGDHRPTAGLSYTKQVSLGLSIYVSDSNDLYPPCDTWGDAVFPYIKSTELFAYRFDDHTTLSPAMNAFMDRKPQPAEQVTAQLVTLFQVVGPARNAWGGPAGAWAGYPQRNHSVAIAFADGHAWLAPRPKLFALRWRP